MNQLLLKLHSFIDGNITTSQQKYRHSWYLLRSERLLDQLMIWDWRNALLILLVSVGGWACSRLNISSRYPKWWAGLVVLCTFGEQIVFSSSWIAYSDKPESGCLYREPEWMPEFRGHVGDGAVVIVNPHNDLDFLCTNHLSTYGIRLASGYETVQPKYLRPLSDGHYHPEDYSMAGISHLLCDSRAGKPDFDGWILVQETEDFFLLENPLYRGRYFVRTQGKRVIFLLLSRIGERIIRFMSPCRQEQRNCLFLRAIPGDGAPAPGRGKSFLYPALSAILFLFPFRIRNSDGNPPSVPYALP